MGESVPEPQQQIAFDQIPEPPPPGFIDLVFAWLTDLHQQEVPGSVVLLIVLVAFGGGILGVIRAYFKGRRER